MVSGVPETGSSTTSVSAAIESAASTTAWRAGDAACTRLLGVAIERDVCGRLESTEAAASAELGVTLGVEMSDVPHRMDPVGACVVGLMPLTSRDRG